MVTVFAKGRKKIPQTLTTQKFELLYFQLLPLHLCAIQSTITSYACYSFECHKVIFTVCVGWNIKGIKGFLNQAVNKY